MQRIKFGFKMSLCPRCLLNFDRFTDPLIDDAFSEVKPEAEDIARMPTYYLFASLSAILTTSNCRLKHREA